MPALPPHPAGRTDLPVHIADDRRPHRSRHSMRTLILGATELDRRRLRDRRALTARELEVLTLAAHGLTGIQIAEQLHVSESTVETHVRRAVQALGAHNRVHAVALAIGRGLIQPPRA
jgi:DNA-binding NarL/FixJ family response regulator